jgi:hypothetical protein
VGGAEQRQPDHRDPAQPGPQRWSGAAGITSGRFQTPTTVARFGRRLAVVNAKFNTGFPPTAKQYEVVVVDR